MYKVLDRFQKMPTHMSHVEVHHNVPVENFAHADSLSSKPVSVGDAVHVPVHWPGVKESVHYGILGEDTETGTEYPAEMESRSISGRIEAIKSDRLTCKSSGCMEVCPSLFP